MSLFGNSGEDEVLIEGAKEILDDMHKRKIDTADGVFVINVGGHIGPRTRAEIEYAGATGKAEMYLATKKRKKCWVSRQTGHPILF